MMMVGDMMHSVMSPYHQPWV